MRRRHRVRAETREHVLRILASQPDLTVHALHWRIGGPMKTIFDALGSLERAGRIAGHWTTGPQPRRLYRVLPTPATRAAIRRPWHRIRRTTP